MRPPVARREPETPRPGFIAGVIGALVMTLAMAVLRLTTGSLSLAESVGESFIDLMPAAVFSAILDVMQKAAKPTLYVGIFIGMLVVGGLLGRGFSFGALTWGRAFRLATIIWAALGLVILPLLGAGLFGSAGQRSGLVALAIQLALVVGAYAATLLLVLRAYEPGTPAAALTKRRQVLVAGVVGGLAVLAAAGTAWRALLGSTAPISTADLTQAPGAGTAAPGSGTEAGGAVAEAPGAAPSPGAVAAGPARGVPRLTAPSVPMTIMADQAAPAPFDVPKLTTEVLTPKEFYTVSKNLIDPTVDVSGWSLKISGLVERPATYLYSDIQALPTYADYYTLMCISNTVGGDLWGNAHWKGVRLVEILSRAGLKDGIRKVVFHAEDGYTDSIPLDAALRPDALLAYEMNGQPLPREHGYPARLLIPGIYGMKNVKWITEIELVDYDFKGFWAKQGWEDNAPYHTASRIDVPANRALAGPGQISLAGVSFAGSRGIDRVEISLDNGTSWEPALLKPALSQNAWNLWVLKKDLGPGTYLVKCRAVDGNGDLQSAEEMDPFPEGSNGYHSIVLRIG
jgi:DMSO/TMAO reductase YedYZ molybdopterin-dependent catalytic subunit